MAKTIAALKTKRFRLGVKQHALVLDFTDGIEHHLNDRGLSQQALATRLGKSRSWISKVLRKKPNLTFFTAVELADALELEVHLDVVPRRVVMPRLPDHVRTLARCGAFEASNDDGAVALADMAA